MTLAAVLAYLALWVAVSVLFGLAWAAIAAGLRRRHRRDGP